MIGIKSFYALGLHDLGFPHSSVGKESACNAGDLGSIPESGRSAGEGIGYPLQYSWASLVAQLVKNPPAMWETWVCSLGWEDPLKKGKATNSSILACRIPMDCIVHGVAKSRTQLSNFHFLTWSEDKTNASMALTLINISPDMKVEYLCVAPETRIEYKVNW